MTKITSPKPSIGGDCAGCFLWLVQVELHHIGTAHQNLAGDTARHLPLGVIADNDLVADSDAGRPDLARAGWHRV